MQQMALSHQAEFQQYAKKTRREPFLEEKEAAMPLAESYYPKGAMGHKPAGLEIMLRV